MTLVCRLFSAINTYQSQNRRLPSSCVNSNSDTSFLRLWDIKGCTFEYENSWFNDYQMYHLGCNMFRGPNVALPINYSLIRNFPSYKTDNQRNSHVSNKQASVKSWHSGHCRLTQSILYCSSLDMRLFTLL